MPAELTIYSRYGCHLCEEMENLLPEYLKATGISHEVVYINGHPELESEFGKLVPVLKAGDREICHYFLDVKALQQYISTKGIPVK